MTLKYTTEQIITLLECATEEGSILQIDMQDFQDALSLCGGFVAQSQSAELVTSRHE